METDHSVLIVDDNPRNLQLLGNILKESGYRVEFATNGAQALEWLDDQAFALVLMDIMMPGMDGLEACRKIRARREFDDMPLIFITARTDKESIVTGFEAGAQDYISKPFDKSELISRVNTHVELFHSRRKLREVNQWLEERVAERTAQLEEANRELLILDQAKTDFLNLIGHELRTPLNGIVGPMELIRSDLKERELEKMLGLMTESVERLERFAVDALLITKLRAGKHRFRRELISLSDIVDRVGENLSAQMLRSNTKLERDFPGSIKLNVDTELIVACFSKIAENFMMHVSGGGVLKVSASRKRGTTEVLFSDPRVELTDQLFENMEILFKPRGHYTDANPGIGLALVSLILELHGGTLEIATMEGGEAAIKVICKESQ